MGGIQTLREQGGGLTEGTETEQGREPAGAWKEREGDSWGTEGADHLTMTGM